MKKIALIDNYDSFTFNLVHYLEDLNFSGSLFVIEPIEIEEINIKSLRIDYANVPGCITILKDFL
jgi:anthranilate/para-aminobenzoate synthase component II